MAIYQSKFSALQAQAGAGGGTQTGLLVGTINGINTVFTLPGGAKTNTAEDVRPFVNGDRMNEGSGNDFVASESGGPSTGFDTVTFLFAPKVGDILIVDFIPL